MSSNLWHSARKKKKGELDAFCYVHILSSNVSNESFKTVMRCWHISLPDAKYCVWFTVLLKKQVKLESTFMWQQIKSVFDWYNQSEILPTVLSVSKFTILNLNL